MFHIGQRVECIRTPSRIVNDLGYPRFQKGDILTVAGIEYDEYYETEFLMFAERSPQHRGQSTGFRPIVERKTDISIFTEMLKPQPKKVDRRLVIREQTR